MSRIATMGTSSCATIAISGFKPEDYTLNETYLTDQKMTGKGNGLSVKEFYDEILYPTSQLLGHTAQYPFELLMGELDKSRMRDKFIITTLNKSQTEYMKGYWLKVLKKWGFVRIDKTNNDIGEICYIFTRNNARVK